MYTVKKNWDRPTLLKFSDWSKDKAEAHERMKFSSRTPKTEDSNPPAKVTRTRTETKSFASTSSSKTTSMGSKTEIDPLIVLLKTKNTPYGGVRCSAKNHYPTNEIGGGQQTLFFLIEGPTFVPQMPKNGQVFKTWMLKHSQYLAPRLRNNFSTKTPRKG